MADAARARSRTLRDLLNDRFGVKTQGRLDPGANSIGLAAVVILPNNPNRLAALIINLSANTVYLAPRPAVSSASGVALAPNGGSFTLLWDEDFDLVEYEWWAIATGAASATLSIEVITL